MRKAIVIDLDGTLLNVNTFKLYILFAGKQALKTGRLDICFILGFMVMLRKIRLISHKRMKWHILMKTWAFMDAPRISAFQKELLQAKNQKVIDLLSEYSQKGFFTVLSTAAPISYAQGIANHWHFDMCIATKMYSKYNTWQENMGVIKKHETLTFLKEHDMSLSVFITDHSDDIPLLLVEKDKNILIHPSSSSMTRIAKAGIEYELL